VVRLDPASGQIVATINVGPSASFLAVGPDAVWVISPSDATVSLTRPKHGHLDNQGVVWDIRR
jgi:hypothetical protein